MVLPFTILVSIALASGIDPQTCSCPEGFGYMYAEQNRGVCGPAYFPPSASDCLVATPEGVLPGRVLCSSPRGTGTPLFNCDPDYRCLQRITKDGQDIQVRSMEGLVQVGGVFGCVRAAEDLYDVEHLCKQGEFARCILLGETVNV